MEKRLQNTYIRKINSLKNRFSDNIQNLHIFQQKLPNNSRISKIIYEKLWKVYFNEFLHNIREERKSFSLMNCNISKT